MNDLKNLEQYFVSIVNTTIYDEVKSSDFIPSNHQINSIITLCIKLQKKLSSRGWKIIYTRINSKMTLFIQKNNTPLRINVIPHRDVGIYNITYANEFVFQGGIVPVINHLKINTRYL